MSNATNTSFSRFVSPVVRSLLEQLKITDHEIESRKELLYFTEDDAKLLIELKPIIGAKIDEIVNEFYDRQLESREIALVIGDADTLKRLREAMRRYTLELFDGVYDAEYVNRRLRIGKVHHRIGVSPKLYVSALSLLQSILYEAIKPENPDAQQAEKEFKYRNAIRKLFLFDMQLVFETYTSTLDAKVEAMRVELEDYIESLEQTVAERTAQLREMTVRDSLTKLFNQRGFFEHLRRELAAAERNHDALTLIYFDLNGFKLVNDVKGHTTGDRLLTLVARSIMSTIREVDFGCRYGGDEFCIILPRATEDEARDVFRRIIETFENGENLGVTISAGFVQSGPDTQMRMETMVQLADARMYEAKAMAKQERQNRSRTGASDEAPSDQPVETQGKPAKDAPSPSANKTSAQDRKAKPKAATVESPDSAATTVPAPPPSQATPIQDLASDG